MKTFEAEKGNIPEGATHYFNETDSDFFAWWDDVNRLMFCPEKHSGWTNQRDITGDVMHEIPQTKEVEWVNGDACRYANDIEHEYTYIGEHPHGDGHYVFSEEKGITYIANGYLLEPETEAERKERERIKSAKHLYSKHCIAVRHPFKDLDKNSELLNAWLVIVDETNYKVKGE